MLHRKGVALVAACAALACTGIVRADTSSSNYVSDEGLVLRPTYLQDATSAPATAPAAQPTTPPKPLMGLLEQAGVGKYLDNLHMTVGGYVDAGYTLTDNGDSASVPVAGRFTDTKNNRIVFDQFDFFIDRPVDYGKAATNHTMDVGGHFELAYGWDAGAFHSSGIFDNPSTLGVRNGFYRTRTSPENQFDILQAYVDVALPVGSGLRIRAGKFVTLLGYEVINPTANAFYSHSYLFSYAIPLTQTGVMGEYVISPDILVDAGVTRGWNQSLRDNNGDPDLLAEITYTPQESDFLKQWKVIGNLSEGPQGTGDNSDWWTVLDASAIFTPANSKWSFAANADYGDAPHAPGVSGAAQWYGVAGYVAFAANKYVTANLRGEYYGDSKGFTLGATGDQNLYEVTLNLQYKPFPDDAVGSNLMIRPEVRYDYSGKDYFKAATHHDQLTFGLDASFVF